MNTQGFLAVLCAITMAMPAAAFPIKKAPSHRAQAQPAGFVDLESYWRNDQQYNAWFNLLDRTRHDFDDICGDTFCEGDYSNIQSLGLSCSARQSDGVLGQCSWNFAGSYQDVDADTGQVNTHFATWACRSPLAVGTTAEQLIKVLDVAHPLYQALPATDQSLYDGLAQCI